jgi:hypothetical protein
LHNEKPIKTCHALKHKIKAQIHTALFQVSWVAEFTADMVSFADPSYDGSLCYFRVVPVIQGELQSNLVAFPEIVGSNRSESNATRGDILYQHLTTLFAFRQFDAISFKIDILPQHHSAFKANGKG